MEKFLLIFFALVAGSLSQVLQQGSCPEFQVVEDFVPSAYAGPWNEIASYPEVFEAGGQCPTAEYTLREDGTVGVRNTMVLGNMLIYVEGSAYQVGSGGSLVVSFDVNGVKTESSLHILATDYESYAVAVTCRDNDDGTRNFSSWILSRQKTLSAAASVIVNNIIGSVDGLQEDLYIYKSHDEDACYSAFSAGYD